MRTSQRYAPGCNCHTIASGLFVRKRSLPCFAAAAVYSGERTASDQAYRFRIFDPGRYPHWRGACQRGAHVPFVVIPPVFPAFRRRLLQRRIRFDILIFFLQIFACHGSLLSSGLRTGTLTLGLAGLLGRILYGWLSALHGTRPPCREKAPLADISAGPEASWVHHSRCAYEM